MLAASPRNVYEVTETVPNQAICAQRRFARRQGSVGTIQNKNDFTSRVPAGTVKGFKDAGLHISEALPTYNPDTLTVTETFKSRSYPSGHRRPANDAAV